MKARFPLTIRYVASLGPERRPADSLPGFHARAVEALALAIEAKNHTKSDEALRVRTHAEAIARDMNVPNVELEALRLAALLHDIGELAIPESILSKPGKLSPEEFEKMKTHTVVGAAILEHAAIPDAVVRIVRSHHEKWDGSGYPDGLAGESIPIGARILAAVDCLEALLADRRHRRALSLDEAVRHVVSLSGTAFDPAVIAAFERRYKRRDTTVIAPSAVGHDFLSPIYAARLEDQVMSELKAKIGISLDPDGIFSAVGVCLAKLIPSEAFAVYVQRGETLFPEHLHSKDFRPFNSREIPLGAGVSGWVAQDDRPRLNADPSKEAAYLDDPHRTCTLYSALSIPLKGAGKPIGALTLYRAARNSFTAEDLRILLALQSQISFAVENALRCRRAESSATNDSLTDLPNARSLFLRLDSEVARCKRSGESLALLVCEADSLQEVHEGVGLVVGDRALRSVASLIRADCREYDYVARMGTNNFVVLLPAGTAGTVTRRIDRLRNTVQDTGAFEAAAGSLSLSFGAAFYPTDGRDAEELLAIAGRRVYQNREEARGRANCHLESGRLPDGQLSTATPGLLSAEK